MNKQSKFDGANLNEIRQIVNQTLEAALKEAGVSVHLGTIRYGAFKARCTLSLNISRAVGTLTTPPDISGMLGIKTPISDERVKTGEVGRNTRIFWQSGKDKNRAAIVDKVMQKNYQFHWEDQPTQKMKGPFSGFSAQPK
jgi:hypothetical protein